jgi:outer membrane protein TolC
LPAELLSRRPDLVAAEQRLEASGARVEEARKALYPRLSLTGSTGSSSNELGDLLDGDFSIWALAGNLLQPIFSGGRLRANVRLQSAQERLAYEFFAQSLLTALAEVETALAAEALLSARVESLERASEQSSEAVRLAEDRYTNGLETYLTVLESQRQSFATDSTLLASRRQLLTARVDLILALGGDFETSGAGSTASSPIPSEAAR